MSETKITKNELSTAGGAIATDANGWSVLDLGLLKIATKAKTFTTSALASGGTAFATITGNNAPVFYASATFKQTIVNVGFTSSAGAWSMYPEQTSLIPTGNWVVRNNTSSSATPSGTLFMTVIMY